MEINLSRKKFSFFLRNLMSSSFGEKFTTLKLEWSSPYCRYSLWCPWVGTREVVPELSLFSFWGLQSANCFIFNSLEVTSHSLWFNSKAEKYIFCILCVFLFVSILSKGKICVSYITAVLLVSLYLVHNGVGNSSNLSEPFFNESNSSFTFRFVGS